MCILASTLRAHEGPPFPVLVDEIDPPWSLSVWADPDVGVGSFYVMLDPTDGDALPADTHVTVHVAPADGRIAETSWPARREARREGQQHVAEVDFPTREFWLVRIVVASASLGRSAERILRVEVTPPGYGPVDLVLYAWPFLALGGLWVKAMLKHRDARRGAASSAPSPAVGTVADPDL